jgi:hypothetical protein
LGTDKRKRERGKVQGMEVGVWCSFIATERQWRGEEVVAGIGGLLEGFSRYRDEKR